MNRAATAATAAMPSPVREPLDEAARGTWSLEQSFALCEAIARSHTENFPVASRFVPAELRRYVFSIYAFARAADDFADEPRYEGRRHQLLDEWEDRLERAYHGEADHPIFIALRETVDRRDIPISPLRDLLTSFRMDLAVRRYATFEALRGYLQHASVPVGRLLLYVFDYRDPALHRYADDMACALQLTHHLQDLPADLACDRLYIPEEDLNHFGVPVEDLKAGRPTPALRDLIRFQAARARALFQRGRPLTDRLGRDLGFELNLMWQSGVCVLDRVEAQRGDVFHRRPELDRFDKARAVVKSAVRRWPVFSR
jgi:squalene synthase HpnC